MSTSAFTGVATVSSGTTDISYLGEWHYMHVDTPADAFMRRADQYADFAMAFAMNDKVATAEICAELADAYALVSQLLRSAESVYCNAELPPLLAAGIAGR